MTIESTVPASRSLARLSAQQLAQLLAAASRHGLEPVCLGVILGNRKAVKIWRLLDELREKVGERFSWRYLAELLAAVDGLVPQLADWPLPLVRRDAKRLPLADLAAAAGLRCQEVDPEASAELADVHRRLLLLIDLQLQTSGPSAPSGEGAPPVAGEGSEPR